MKVVAFLSLILISLPIFAESEEEFEECYLPGFFQGEGSSFLYEIAIGLVASKNLLEFPECQERVQAGIAIGQHYKETGTYNYDKDQQIMQDAIIFKAKVRRFIIKGAELDSD
jgi:hypothetical protein